MRKTLGLAATAVALGWGGGAMAATVKPKADPVLVPTTVACEVGEVTLGTAAADACLGSYNGNNLQNDTVDLVEGLFGEDWHYVATLNTPGSYVVDDKDSDPGLTASGGTSGTWGVDDFLGYETVMIVIKGGDSFAAYLFEDVGDAVAGTFSTASLIAGQCPKKNGGPCNTGPGLSHISLYVTGNPIVPPPVPVPAAGVLLLSGLAGLPLLKRRRRR